MQVYIIMRINHQQTLLDNIILTLHCWTRLGGLQGIDYDYAYS
jgi:hypothetical protein